MTVVARLVLIWVRNVAHMNRAVFGGREVILSSLTCGEINCETTCSDESDARLLIFFIGVRALENVLLVWVSFSLERCQLDHVEAPLHLPLRHFAIARD